MRERLASTIQAIAAYEEPLAATLSRGLAAIPGVTICRAPDGVAKTPTVAFTVAGTSPGELAWACAEQAIFVTNGDFYATTLAELMGVSGSGGWVRVGLAPYIGPDEVNQALAVLERAITARQAAARRG